MLRSELLIRFSARVASFGFGPDTWCLTYILKKRKGGEYFFYDVNRVTQYLKRVNKQIMVSYRIHYNLNELVFLEQNWHQMYI